MIYRRLLAVSLPIVLAIAGYGCPSGSSNCTVRVGAAILRNTSLNSAGVYSGCQDNAFNVGGTLNVASSGNNGNNMMEVNFGVPATVGTTTVAVNSPLSFQVEVGTGIWNASQGQGSGSLTITTLTATGAKGTFNFTAAPSSGGATGNWDAINGTFEVTF